MYTNASKILKENTNTLASIVTSWVIENHPLRTNNFEKCSRDLRYIIKALVHCLHDNNSQAIDHISTMFFTNNILQLKTTDVEFAAYDVLLNEIEKIFTDAEEGAISFCKSLIEKLKNNLQNS